MQRRFPPVSIRAEANGHAEGKFTVAPPDETPVKPALVALPIVPLTLSRKEVAALIGGSVSEMTIKRRTADSSIPGVCRIGRRVLYSRAAIEEWVRQGCPRPERRRGKR